MSRNLLVMLAGAGLCFLFTNGLNRPAAADSEKKDPAGPARIAVVDMTRIFTTAKFFQQKREALKSKMTEYDETLRRMYAELEQMAKKFKGLDQNAEDRKELETRIKKKQAEFEEFRLSNTRKFQKEEAEIYVQTYRKVSPEIATYAQSNGIDLVIHHQPEPQNADDPMASWQTLNRLVIYENKLDITDEIIAALAE